jgi:prepilin-type processing-associated H-X9-DG protein
MRPIITVSILLLGSITGESVADCSPSTRVRPIAVLNTLLDGKTLCGEEVGGTDQWQEEHRSRGVLWERAKGPSDPVDPSRSVGTWIVEGTGGGPGGGNPVVRYNYTGGSSYSFSVHDNGSNYSFCDGTTEVVRAIITSGGCSF